MIGGNDRTTRLPELTVRENVLLAKQWSKPTPTLRRPTGIWPIHNDSDRAFAQVRSKSSFLVKTPTPSPSERTSHGRLPSAAFA